MSQLRLATMDDLKTVQNGFKLYKKDGKFTYVRNDYIVRSIEAGDVWLNDGMLGVIHQLTRGGRMGDYKSSAGEWNVHQVLSLNREDKTGPFRFWREFTRDVVKNGRVFGAIHDSNKTSMDFHLAFGFKKVGTVVWANGTVPGTVVAYDCGHNMDKFIR